MGHGFPGERQGREIHTIIIDDPLPPSAGQSRFPSIWSWRTLPKAVAFGVGLAYVLLRLRWMKRREK